MKIYLSGAIANDPNYKLNFQYHKELLEKKGYEVLSPLETDACKNNKPVKDCMNDAINMLHKADCMVQISPIEISKGMQIERDYAKYCGIPIRNELIGNNKRWYHNLKVRGL
jgi:nucleoside 2-deoxyribosyltransferase